MGNVAARTVRLRLARETLRRLDDAQLACVRGGDAALADLDTDFVRSNAMCPLAESARELPACGPP